MSSQNSKKHHVYPASMAVFLDNGLRKLSQDPEKILAGLIKPGDACADIGCGPGFFTVEMAKMAGPQGGVFACDVQQEMLDMTVKKAAKRGLKNIIPAKSTEGDIGLKDKIDFALCFGVVHETGDPAAFFRQLSDVMNPGGKVLFVEPQSQVSEDEFKTSIDAASAAGLRSAERRNAAYSRAVVLVRR